LVCLRRGRNWNWNFCGELTQVLNVAATFRSTWLAKQKCVQAELALGPKSAASVLWTEAKRVLFLVLCSNSSFSLMEKCQEIMETF
jgi:hypothetical protein